MTIPQIINLKQTKREAFIQKRLITLYKYNMPIRESSQAKGYFIIKKKKIIGAKPTG